MARRRVHPGLAVSFGLAALLAVSQAAAAAPAPAKEKAAPAGKPSKGKKGDAAPNPEIDALKQKLSGSEEQSVEALRAIAEANDPEMAPLVQMVLERGGTNKVLDEALKTAAKLKVASLSKPVAPYTQHRAEDIRRAAVRTLLKTKGPDAVVALKAGLRSPDAVVRGTSATGLGELGAHDALSDLFLAFDHGVAEAGAAIGQLCTPEECEKFAERTGRVAFDVMVTGFDQILFRPPAEIPDEAKIRLIGRMREMGTPEVGKYLADVGERWPKEWSKKVKQAIDSAARAVGGKK